MIGQVDYSTFVNNLTSVISKQKGELESELRRRYLDRMKENVVRDIRNEIGGNWEFYSTFAIVLILAYVVYKRL